MYSVYIELSKGVVEWLYRHSRKGSLFRIKPIICCAKRFWPENSSRANSLPKKRYTGDWFKCIGLYQSTWVRSTPAGLQRPKSEDRYGRAWPAVGLRIGIRERYGLSLLYLFQRRLYGGTVWSAGARRGSAGNAAGALSIKQPSGILHVTVGRMFEEQQYCSNAVAYQFTRFVWTGKLITCYFHRLSLREILAFQAEISYNINVKSVLAHLVRIVSFHSLVGVLYLKLKVQDLYQSCSGRGLFIYRLSPI